uniref:Uncharacterized protein n=1 Tax=viral metagenome TaxID=1070528 RepID=A0A6C0K4F6_9ZZZZ
MNQQWGLFSFLYSKEMEIQTLYQCDCNPGKRYSSRQTFQHHVSSKRHQLFTQNKNKSDLYKRLQDTEIELVKARKECEVWKHKYLDMMLEKEEEEKSFQDCQ